MAVFRANTIEIRIPYSHNVNMSSETVMSAKAMENFKNISKYLNGFLSVKFNEELQLQSIVINIVITDDSFAAELETPTCKWITLANLKKRKKFYFDF